MAEKKAAFDHTKYLIQLKRRDKKSGKDIVTDYLPVRGRLLWMRSERGDSWGISTSILFHGGGVVAAQATILDENGRLIAQGMAEAPEDGMFPPVMKAETAAIGRALAHAGYGTEFVDDEDEIVDGPVERPTPDFPIDAPVTRKEHALFSLGKPGVPMSSELIVSQMDDELKALEERCTAEELDFWLKHYATAVPVHVRAPFRERVTALKARLGMAQ